MYLEKINSPKDVKILKSKERSILSDEIRQALIQRLSIHGGHCGPNLGFVEATIALHCVFDSPKDKIVFDVSHQSYVHKMLTGRKAAYLNPDNYDNVSGYSCPTESAHDLFEVGHTSTSVSLACGLAKARDLKNDTENIIAVIGDGSLSGGEALEGLNVAAELDSNIIIIVNDNGMSIAENHGGMYKNLQELRENNGSATTNLFTAMGLNYVFVQHGNDIDALIEAFRLVKDTKVPTVVHIITEKGKGYKPAETDKESWHWSMPFDIETGAPKYSFNGENYEQITVNYLLDKMKKDKTVIGITSGTPAVFGFNKANRDKAGKQFIDVGIAEETAVALSSGLSKNGAKPVYGVYSTFIQRTYDQISQDVCINNSAVTFLVYAASIWGMNDVTHLGIYDIPMLSNIPNLVYLAPTCKEEYLAMTEWAIEQKEHPVAVRVPSNGVISSKREIMKDYSNLNKYEITRTGKDVAIIALGDFYQLGEHTAEKLDAALINPRYITGLDNELLENLKKDYKIIVTLEDGILDGGFGQKIASFYGNSKMRVLNYGFKKEFLDRYTAQDIMEQCRITPTHITEDVNNVRLSF